MKFVHGIMILVAGFVIGLLVGIKTVEPDSMMQHVHEENRLTKALDSIKQLFVDSLDKVTSKRDTVIKWRESKIHENGFETYSMDDSLHVPYFNFWTDSTSRLFGDSAIPY